MGQPTKDGKLSAEEIIFGLLFIAWVIFGYWWIIFRSF